ncbi:ABC transporter permease [Pilimelia columellifera]|uniref:Transport permease protein n=1 Tax=Pilimelia columellifera subsp. columellifera TaxID=706583 RepID=A0ABP6AIC3_9ACTN
MVTSALIRLGVGSAGVVAVVERNFAVFRRARFLVLLSGVAEPILYLLSIGVGVGALIGDIRLADGRAVPYVAFVAPAMLASAAMSGAVAETVFNFFARMRYQRLYDAVLSTPVRPWEIALGELGWATIRGALYCAVFLALMVGMGLASWGAAALALPATLLVGVVFGAMGMAASTFLRSWQDFDLVITVQMAFFLFSATFVPVERFPTGLRWLVELSPLTQGVRLLRGILVGGESGWSMALAASALVAFAVVCFAVAARRIRRLLCP